MRSLGRSQQQQQQQQQQQPATSATVPSSSPQLPPLPRLDRGEATTRSPPPPPPATSSASNPATNGGANGGKSLTARTLRYDTSAAAATAAPLMAETPLATLVGGTSASGAPTSRSVSPLLHPSPHTSTFSSSADATTVAMASSQQGPPRGASSTPLSESLSWRAVATPTSPLAPPVPAGPNHSCFGKAKGPARAAGTARTPPPPPPSQSAPTQALSRTAPPGKSPAAVPSALFSVQRRPPHRRDSAGARASVLATSRHRRLMPLAERTREGDEAGDGEDGDEDMSSAGRGSGGGGGFGAAAFASHRVGGGGSGVDSFSRGRREQGQSSADLGGTTGAGRRGPDSAVSSPVASNLSSPRAFHAMGSGTARPGGRGGARAPLGRAEAGDHGVFVVDWVRVGSHRQSSSGSAHSRASDTTAAHSSSSDLLTASLTSLQHRLWTRTAGHEAVMTITAAASSPKRGGDATRPSFPSAASLHSPPHTAVVPVAQWKLSLDSERVSGELGKHVANWMVARLLNPASGAGLRGGSPGLGDSVDFLDDDERVGGGGGDDGGGYLRPLCDRAVVAAYLLRTLLGGLPRHQQSLSPYVHMLLDFTFVSDAAVNRAILGGSVQDEELLHTLEVLHDAQLRSGMEADDLPRLPPPAPAGTASTRYSSASTISGVVHRGSRSSCHIGAAASTGGAAGSAAAAAGGGGGAGQTVTPSGNGALYDLLYPNFTRKTYAAAHYEAAGATIALAHDVRSRELHQRSVPRLLECMHRHLMRWFVRAVLHAWRGLCRERRVQQQRQRARWAARWTSERVRISLRRWRGYAALTLQVAEADSLAMALLSEKRAGIERLENESAAMQVSSEKLRRTLHNQDEERDQLEGVIVRREQYYKKLLRYVREMDRVGSMMLRSLLLSEPPPVPHEAAALNGVNAAVASAFSAGQRRPSRLSITGSFVDLVNTESVSSAAGDGEGGGEVEVVVRHPPYALVALPTLLRWAKACVEPVESEYTGFFPDEDDEDEGEEALKTAPTATKSGGSPRGKGNASASPVVSPGKGRSGRQGHSAVTVIEPKAPEAPAGAKGRVVDTETTRGYSCGLELLLSPTTTAGASATAATATCSAFDTVLTPLHMLLLLMRGCAMADDDAATAAATTAGASSMFDAHGGPLSAGSAGVPTAGMDGDAATVAGPSWDLIRTIELADRVILDECAELLRHDEEQLSHTDLGAVSGAMPPRGKATAGAASAVSGSSSSLGSPSASTPVLGSTLMYRLTPASRANLQRMCRVVIDAYEQLTGTACIVTAEQLFERSRGTLLVLVAALMRYYTNWSTHRAHHLAPSSSSAAGTASMAASQAYRSIGPLGANTSTHEGARHKVYDEWSHPPYSHRGWLAHVRRQAQWIALSFSALHDAVRLATTPTEVLSMVEQERVSRLVQHIPLTEFIDVLCRSPEHTMQSYVDIIGVVERYAPSLHLVFHQYALPLSRLRADGAVEASGSDEEVAGARSTTEGDELYITGNTLWHLLQVTGIAGKTAPSAFVSAQRGVSAAAMPLAVPSPPLSATLHRPAVFSLIEQVTQGGLASTGVLRRRGSMRRASVSPVPSGVGGAASPLLPDEPQPFPGSATRPAFATAVTVSCQGRPIPCYARALRDDRHIDLRSDTGAVCLNYVQFVKVMIRLAHAWQCQQKQQPLVEVSPAEEAETAAALKTLSASLEMPYERGADAPQPRGSSSGLSRHGSARALPVASAPSSGQRRERNEQGGGNRPSYAEAGGGAGSAAYIQYEYVDYADPLCPPYFTSFLGGLLLPRLLGANRWMGATQRATMSKPVLELLARHHDSLLAVFEVYQRPCETRGIRGGLPPPFSTILASRVFGKIVDAERRTTTSLTADGGRGLSHAERASFVYAIAGSPSRRASVTSEMNAMRSATGLGATQRGRATTRSQAGSVSGARVGFEDAASGPSAAQAAASRDIGIVSVLRWKEVQVMAKDLAWHSEPHVTELALRHCFEHVVADAAREGEVLFFAEFLQLLCAISVYVTPNMMVPLEKKLEPFLKTRVLTLLE